MTSLIFAAVLCLSVVELTLAGATCSCNTAPRDCGDVYALGNTVSGVYTIYVGSALRPVRVWCDQTTDGGGWTVIQRRRDGSEDFARTYQEYVNGFGNQANEHWMGLKYLRSITASNSYRLRIDLQDFSGTNASAEYSKFLISESCDQYMITSLGDYCTQTTTLGDLNSMDVHLWNKFYARDNDNGVKCAAQRDGGWWFTGGCGEANLNGLYLPTGTASVSYDGIMWWPWTGANKSLKFSEMKLRRNDV